MQAINCYIMMMKLITVALLLVSIPCKVFSGQVDVSMGLPGEAVTLASEVDGKSAVTTIRVTTSKDTDRWIIRSAVPWLQVAPTRGIGSQQLTVRVVPGALEPGQYSASLFQQTIRILSYT